ncbi:hypothetical protein [Bartonella choladocola]|uniref:Uncharacterized protein n=1 Tax=Bartonella choladocola TaxID=2750995 RepID=A0A1U9MJZ8_9HYPH|nr:hypothetical protein [Bartonella choladocola]AQT47971.1 hypothetical protein BBC0122_018760 [Bartonella choladocola]
MKIDNRLGEELGLVGHFEKVPAYQIINDTYAKLNGLNARLTDFRHNMPALAQSDMYADINKRAINVSQTFFAGVDAVHAAEIFDEIEAILGEINKLDGRS